MLGQKLKISIKPTFTKCVLLRDTWYVNIQERRIGAVLLRCGKWHYEREGKIGPVKGLVSRSDAVNELLRLDNSITPALTSRK